MSLIERAAAKLLAEKKELKDEQAGTAPERQTPEPRSVRVETPAAPSVRNRFDLDLERLRTLRCLTPDGEPRLLAQEYRRIKRPILFTLKESLVAGQPINGANLIMVTSAVPNEGKSYVSTNLALSIATEIDQTVLLVDADLAKRGASANFGLDKMPGLSDLAQGRAAFTDVLVHTNINTLSILPAGTASASMDELFASEAMSTLLMEMSNRYDDRIIIIDTPPVFSMNVPLILSKIMGQVIFVIEADKTPQHIVEEALAQLAEVKSLSLVLNKASRRMPSSNYGYGYYGYGAEK